MIRPLTLVILLSLSATALSQPLYKWVEKDGSITFSVSAPPEGVEFETISNTDLIQSQSAKAPQNTTATAPAAEAVAEQGSQLRLAPALAPRQAIAVNPTQSTQPSATTREIVQDQRVSVAKQAGEQTLIEQNSRASSNAKNRKQQQCEDLRKRVVSLERRLQSRLTPDDMDNTVIHMARYQRSYDQHCVQ